MCPESRVSRAIRHVRRAGGRSRSRRGSPSRSGAGGRAARSSQPLLLAERERPPGTASAGARAVRRREGRLVDRRPRCAGRASAPRRRAGAAPAPRACATASPPAADAPHVVVDVRRVGQPQRRRRAQERVGAGAEAAVLAERPAVEVVAAAAARPREVGDLVPLVPGARRSARAPAPASPAPRPRRAARAARPRAPRRTACPPRCRARRARGARGRASIARARSRRQTAGRLPGQAVDQVDPEVVEPGGAQQLERRRAPRGAVCRRPMRASSASSSDCTPSETRFTPSAAKSAGLRGGQRPGVRLDRDLGARARRRTRRARRRGRRASCPPSSRLGVPPPKKTVPARRPASGAAAISRSSAAR